MIKTINKEQLKRNEQIKELEVEILDYLLESKQLFNTTAAFQKDVPASVKLKLMRLLSDSNIRAFGSLERKLLDLLMDDPSV